MTPANAEAIHPMSPSQRGMLFDALSAPAAGIHIEQSVIRLRGDVDTNAFAGAWRALIRTHAALRTSFLWTDVEEPLQVVSQDVTFDVEIIETDLDRYLADDRRRGFDMSTAPLMRVALLRDGLGESNDWTCVWTHHHILLDGWCVPLLVRDLLAAYDALRDGNEPALRAPRPYSDYIAWLRDQDLRAAESLWRDSLENITRPTALGRETTASRDLRSAISFGECRAAFSVAETTALRATARRQHLPLNIVVQGAWAALLMHYSGDAKVVFGATIAGRPEELTGVESMIGLFINTIPVAVALDRSLPMNAWLRELHAAQAARERFGYVAAGQVHEWSAVPPSLPLFESLLVFENFPSGALASRHLTLDVAASRAVGANTRYPLNHIIEPGEVLSLCAVHDRARLANAASILADLQFVLRLFVSMPSIELRAVLDALRGRTVPEVTKPPSTTNGGTPKNGTEAQLLSAWRDVLGTDIGTRDNLFEHGGHSLVATRIAARLPGVPLRAIFEYPTVESLAAHLQPSMSVAPPIVPCEERGAVSFAQERLWFLDQLEPGSAAYNVQGALRVSDADVEALEHAITEIVRRHEILRTNFRDVDGRPVAFVREPFAIRIRRFDGDYETLAREELLRPFDLANDPLLRVALAGDVLIVTMHHIITDGWSNSIFLRELAEGTAGVHAGWQGGGSPPEAAARDAAAPA
ncbi:MAG TPA: condensation domain-containing protein, partial [Thermoanaerobaculia bacterium]|nr:condensation domain-containing protein [Thermoanaerobaculia bacterium]